MQVYSSLENKYLKIADGVILTSQIDSVITRLDSYFKTAGMIRYVISGLREKTDQLRIIIDYANSYKLPVDYTKDDTEKKLDDGTYVWQQTWSDLLDKGLLINPPNAAKCLGTYKHGQIIQPSSHFRGVAFDISGSKGNTPSERASTVDDELKVVLDAMADPKLGIRSYTVERANNCLHINV